VAGDEINADILFLAEGEFAPALAERCPDKLERSAATFPNPIRVEVLPTKADRTDVIPELGECPRPVAAERVHQFIQRGLAIPLAGSIISDSEELIRVSPMPRGRGGKRIGAWWFWCWRR